MEQNASRSWWDFEYTENKLKLIMQNIFRNCKQSAEEFGSPFNFVNGCKYRRLQKSGRCHAGSGHYLNNTKEGNLLFSFLKTKNIFLLDF